MEREPGLKINSKLTISQGHQLFGRCQVNVYRDDVLRFERQRAVRAVSTRVPTPAVVPVPGILVKVEKVEAPVDETARVRKTSCTPFPGPSCSTAATVGFPDKMDVKPRIKKEPSRTQTTAVFQKKFQKRNRALGGRCSCLFCEKECLCWSVLEVHMRVHTNETPLTCLLCPATFRTPNGLKGHQLAAHSKGQKKFACGHCGKRFHFNKDLKRHERVHRDHRPFPCNLCEKSFRRKDHLETHLRRHTGERPYKCEACGKRFVTKPELKGHLYTHRLEEDRPFKCSRCPKTFCQKVQLKTHVNRHIGKKPYNCGTCKRAFYSYWALWLHRTTERHRLAAAKSREAAC